MNKHFFHDLLGAFLPKRFPNKEYESERALYESIPVTQTPTPHSYPTSDPDIYDWKLLVDNLGVMLYEVPTPSGQRYRVYDSVTGKERQFYTEADALKYMREYGMADLLEEIESLRAAVGRAETAALDAGNVASQAQTIAYTTRYNDVMM